MGFLENVLISFNNWTSSLWSPGFWVMLYISRWPCLEPTSRLSSRIKLKITEQLEITKTKSFTLIMQNESRSEAVYTGITAFPLSFLNRFKRGNSSCLGRPLSLRRHTSSLCSLSRSLTNTLSSTAHLRVLGLRQQRVGRSRQLCLKTRVRASSTLISNTS